MTPQSTLLASPKLNQADAAKAAGVSVSTWKRLVLAGDAPQALMIAGQKRWLESDIEQWIIRQNPHLQEAIELKKQVAAVIANSKFKKKNGGHLRAVGA